MYLSSLNFGLTVFTFFFSFVLLCFSLCGSTYYNDTTIINSFFKKRICSPYSWETSSASGSSEQGVQVYTMLYYMLLDALLLPHFIYLNSCYILYLVDFFPAGLQEATFVQSFIKYSYLLHLPSK